MSNGTKLGNVVLNAGVLKYPNRATDMYVCPILFANGGNICMLGKWLMINVTWG